MLGAGCWVIKLSFAASFPNMSAACSHSRLFSSRSPCSRFAVASLSLSLALSLPFLVCAVFGCLRPASGPEAQVNFGRDIASRGALLLLCERWALRFQGERSTFVQVCVGVCRCVCVGGGCGVWGCDARPWQPSSPSSLTPALLVRSIVCTGNQSCRSTKSSPSFRCSPTTKHRGQCFFCA